ncbi:MAG: hypothetical protein JWL64_1255 [Frankiales bacterium]|nr:hypothetical protein [Frankiales bacterium]
MPARIIWGAAAWQAPKEADMAHADMTHVEELARRGFEAFNAHDLDAMAGLTHPDAELTVVGSDQVLRGEEGTRQYARMWLDAFPDARVTVDRVLVSGDTAVIEFTGRGTHTGTLNGPGGSIPATGRSLTLPICEIQEFRDDKMVASRSYFDTALILAQLGVLPAPAQTDR